MEKPVVEASERASLLSVYSGSRSRETLFNMPSPAAVSVNALAMQMMMDDKPATLGASVVSNKPTSRGSRRLRELGQPISRDYLWQGIDKELPNYQLRSTSYPPMAASYTEKPPVNQLLSASDTEPPQEDSPPPVTRPKKSSRRSVASFKQFVTKAAPKVQASKESEKLQPSVALSGGGGALVKPLPPSYRPRRQARARETQGAEQMERLAIKAPRLSQLENQAHASPCAGDVALMKTTLKNSAVLCVVLNVFKSLYPEGHDECVVAFLLEPRHATCTPAQLQPLTQQEVECFADAVVTLAGKTSQLLQLENAERVSYTTAACGELLCPVKALTQSLRTKRRVRRVYERLRTAIDQSHAIIQEEPSLCLHDFWNCHFCTRIADTELNDRREGYEEAPRVEQWHQFFLRKPVGSHSALKTTKTKSKRTDPFVASPDPDIGNKEKDIQCESSKKRRKKDTDYRTNGVSLSGGSEPAKGPPKLQPSKRPRCKADGSNDVTVMESPEGSAALVERTAIEAPTLPRVKLTDVASCTTVSSGPEIICSTSIGRRTKPFKGKRSAAQAEALPARNTTLFSASTCDSHSEIVAGSVEQENLSSSHQPAGDLASLTQSIVSFRRSSDMNVVSQRPSSAISFNASPLRDFSTELSGAIKDGTTLQPPDFKLQDLSLAFFCGQVVQAPEKPVLTCTSPFSSTEGPAAHCSICPKGNASAVADCAWSTAALSKSSLSSMDVSPCSEQQCPINEDQLLEPSGLNRVSYAIDCSTIEDQREQEKFLSSGTAACDICDVALVHQWTGGVRGLKPKRGLCSSCAFVCVCGFLTPYTDAFIGFSAGTDVVRQPAGPYCANCWRQWMPQLEGSGISIHLNAASTAERQWKYRQCFLDDNAKGLSQSESLAPSVVC